ncbi:MAG: M36 family metallopeptidase [Acidobacteriota bacterium]|nr:MAG: M36 family metallopeptidase [Acidobacteriota bacterium]
MSREIDRRDHSVNRVTPAREAELRERAALVSDTMPGAHRVRVARMDPTTGNPNLIVSESAPAEEGNHVQRALDHLRGLRRVLGLVASQPIEYQADPQYQTTSSGSVAVHLQQLYKGIPIFQAAETVRFDPNGAIHETAGSSVSVPEEVVVSSGLTVEQAVLIAARHVAAPEPDELGAKDQFGEPLQLASVDLAGWQPKVSAAFAEKPERLTVLEAGPFGDQIKARLVWFPLDGGLRLTWEVILTMPAFQGQYRTLVDAQTEEILFCRQLVRTAIGRGNVYRVDGGSSRQGTDFPRPLADYGLPIPPGLPPAFPDDWVGTDRTEGNSVFARLGSSGQSGTGVNQGGTVVFDPPAATGDDQKVLNIFYYNCVMHDFFYLLGFREQDGNFQSNNLGRGGLAADRVDARAHSGPVFGTANMATPADGLSPIMNMGLVSSTNRHTAFDSSVVFHEFTHGVSNRLVGGPADDRALEAIQSGGMGEGWSDYIACSINDATVVGNWVVNDPGGIRGFPYDSNFPDHFGKLGTGRYNQVHNIGEIWCATLMEMNRKIGKVLGLQLVVDGFKLTPANPSFLDARDAILRALEGKRSAGQITQAEYDAARKGIWEAFAKFGMGPNARSNGATLSGIVADFNVPPPVTPPAPGSTVTIDASPNLAIPDNNAAGISHVISVGNDGRIKRLTVSVDIAHTFIGDLRVTLETPGGKSAVLHNRAGGGSDNLVKAYRSEDISALAALLGDQAKGDWRLRVVDLARIDVGALRRWGLEMDLEGMTQAIHEEVAPGVVIPDNVQAGASSVINIGQTGNARGVKVGIDITHTWIGDLRVELTAPSGRQVLLHDRSGGSADNLIRDYDTVSSPGMAALIGEAIQGNWTLRVRDLAAQDTGKLNRWSLDLTI